MSKSDLATRESLILKRVPHFARICLIVFASAATSCSSERPQKVEESKEMARQLTAAYYSCVRTSFTSQLPTMVDRNMAMDQAFMVCHTEEAKHRKYYFREPECGPLGPPQCAERGTVAAIVLVALKPQFTCSRCRCH